MRREYFEKLLQLTREQTRTLVQEDMERFQELLDAREEVFALINELNDESPEPLSEEELELLNEIKSIDDKNNKEFMAQLEFAKAEVKRINLLMKRDSYYNNPYSVAREEGILFDRK